MSDFNALALLLAREFGKIERPQMGLKGTDFGSLAVIKDGRLLSPRETRKFVVSCYEMDLGRKLTKKEANLAMMAVRKALTVSVETDELVTDDATGRPVEVKRYVTWGPEAFDESGAL